MQTHKCQAPELELFQREFVVKTFYWIWDFGPKAVVPKTHKQMIKKLLALLMEKILPWHHWPELFTASNINTEGIS